MIRTKMKTSVAVFFLASTFALSNLVSLTNASHFRGGIISWRPLEQPNGNLTNNFLPEIEIYVRVAWRRTASGHFCTEEDISSKTLLSGEGSLSCSCNGLNFRLNYYCTDFSENENWSTGVNTGQYQPTSAVFDIWFSGCCWISLRNGGSSWNLGAFVNLTVRSDTGLINSSPTTITTPIIRFQRGCNNTVKIPVSDPDGDHVRCFWASRRCGRICNGLRGAVLDTNTCELSWNVDDSFSLGLYGVAIEIADFESPTSSNALSYIPLQFLIDVISSTQSCFSKPIFVPPTRLPGSCVGVPPNTTYHEPVVVRTGSPHLSITNVDTVTPQGVEKSDIFPYSGGTSNDYYLNVTWTPQTVGFEEILCFTARDSAGSDSTQSCFTLVTGTQPPLILDGFLQPSNKEMVLPSDMTVKLRFDQDIVRPAGPSMISLVQDNGGVVYQVDSGDPQRVNFIGNRGVEFVIPRQFLEEGVTYLIHMDSGVVRSTTFCGVESPKIDDDFWTFFVRDVTPPVLRFNPSLSRTNENVTISWTLNEKGNTTCTLSSPTETNIDSCDGLWTGTFLSQGYHTLYVSATDTSGNTGPSQQVSWFVDKTPPNLDVYERPDEITNETSVEFVFRCTDYRDSCQFICGYSSVDQDPNIGPCTSPVHVSGLLNNFQYRFLILAVDSAGNKATEVNITWFVDTEPPTVSNIASAVVACNTSFDPSITGVPSVLDNQDIAPTLTYVDIPLPDCSFNRVWTAMDFAGNLATSVQRLVIETELFPEASFPPFIAIPCSDDFETDIDNANSKNGDPVSHPCGRPVVVTYTDDVELILCGREFIRFWTIEDDCGTLVGSQQRIRILDAQYPGSPANGQVNVELRASLSWPSYPGAMKHRIFVWEFESIRPSAPVQETHDRTFSPSVPYPPNTRMLWQVEYVLERSERHRRQAELTTVPSPIWGFVTMGFPDLTVTDIFIPDFAFSGQSMTISWEVRNIGHVGLSPIRWVDGIYFSFFIDPSENMQLQTSEEIRRFVDPNDGYVFTASWKLPEDLIGTFYVFLETDLYNRVDDLDRSNNIRRADGSVEVRLTPPADLQVTSVVVPSSSFSGLEVDIRWSVNNLGLGITKKGEWSDSIFFSEDGFLDRRDKRLLTVPHDGLLSPGTGYSKFESVKVPNRIFGEFYFIVATDVWNEIYEHATENNNVLNSSSISVTLSPPADLEVIQVDVQPNPAISGDSVAVSWEVRNGGSGLPDSHSWYDQVQLGSGSIVHQIVDRPLIAEELSPSLTYQKTSTFTLKDTLSSGAYQLYVTTDLHNTVFEFDKEDNNQLIINFDIVQKLPDLVVSTADAFLSYGQTKGGSFLTLNWTVTNEGPGKTLRGSITDSVTITSCQTTCKDRYLGNKIFYGILPNQGSYNVTNEIFPLPDDMSGKLQVRITTDALSRHLESTLDSNDITINIEVPCLAPSIVVGNVRMWTSLQGPVVAYTAGEDITVTWRVTNEGNATLKANYATAILSLFRTSFPLNTRLLGTVTYSTHLPPLTSLTQNITITLPSDITGNTSLHISHEWGKPICGIAQAVTYGSFNVQPPPTPNLKVTNVDWILGASSDLITIKWTIENIGNTMTAKTRWSDEVFISSFPGNGQSQGVSLGSYFYNSVIASGQHYNSSKTLLLPNSPGGSFYITVVNTFELIPGQSNIRGQSAKTDDDLVHLPASTLPDLYVKSNSQVPLNVSIGSRLTVYFYVKNNGSMTTASSWTDEVYLVQQPLRIQLSLITHRGRLDFQEDYHSTVSFQIPTDLIGSAFIEITVDATYQVNDPKRENNVLIIAEVDLYKGPLGDLTASIEKDEIQLRSGQPFIFEYNATNIGTGLIDGAWNDAYFLSQDAYIDPFDVRLGSNANSGTYKPGEILQRSVELFLPFDLPNSVLYLIIVLDNRNDIFEEDESNNVVRKSITVQAGISTDLAVISVVSPSTVSYGNNFLVSWSVENLGLQTANGYKCDAVYLSTDRKWNVQDSEISQTCTHFSLQSNSKSPANTGNYLTNLPLPLVTAGEMFALVRTRSNVRDLNLENNIGYDETPVLVSYPELNLGDPIISQIDMFGYLAFKIPSVPADETLILEITSPSEYDVNKVFLKYKEIASANNFDAVSEALLGANKTAVISPTREGDYFALIQNNGALDTSYSDTSSVLYISAKLARFEILSVTPTEAAPLGNVTVTVHGTVFPEVIFAKLRNDSDLEITSSQIFRFSSQELYVTFDVSKTNIGTWFDLILNDEVNFTKALQIIPGVKGRIIASVNNPGRLRPFEVGQVDLDVQNIGNVDILVPLLTFTISEPGLVRFIAGGEASDWANTHAFFPTPSKGPAGIISPGSSQRFSFEVRSLEPIAIVGMSVSILPPENPNIPNLFLDAKDNFKPFMHDAERWDRVWTAFLDVTGPSHETFTQHTSNVLNHLSFFESRPRLVEEVVRHQINLVDGFGYLTSPLIEHTDIATTPGDRGVLSLGYAREMNLQLSYRAVKGVFGRGWSSFWWNIRLISANDTRIILEQENNFYDFLKSDEDEKFLNVRGIITWNDTDLIYHDAYSAYARLIVFDSITFALKYVTAIDDAKTLSFETNDHNVPVLITSSTGSRLSITYTLSGLVEEVNLFDRIGRVYQTARYTYDRSGTYLLSTENDGKVTSYTYANDGAIASITDYKGVQQQFYYDAVGILEEVSVIDSSGEIITRSSITDHRDGRVTVLDSPSGVSSTFTYTLTGAIGASQTVGYPTYKLYEDITDRSIKMFWGDHVTSKYVYDPEKNAYYIYNGNNDMREVSTESSGKLKYFVDANNNKYEYDYNEETRVQMITYPDGTFESRKLDDKGFLTEQISRKGTKSSFAVDEDGLIIERHNEGEDHYYFMYDERGLVTEATNNVGTIKISYTSSGNPRTVEYPDGKTLIYDYDDKGRRTGLRDDSSYQVIYEYDSRSRVIRVKEGNKENDVVSIKYDKNGRIFKKVFPNGCESVHGYREGSSEITEIIHSCKGSITSAFGYKYNGRGYCNEINSTYGHWKITYDGEGQVVAWSDPQGNDYNIGYDKAGNRRFLEMNGNVTSYTVNNLNQYLQVGSIQINYDDSGNVIETEGISDSSSYEFNVNNQLTTSQIDGNECIYHYNAMGTLHEKICSGHKTMYYMDFFGDLGADVLIETTKNDEIKYFHSTGIGLIGKQFNGNSSFYQFDGTGSVVGLVDESGYPLELLAYDPFGNIFIKSGSSDNLFQFCGQFGVLKMKETGLYLMRTRLYDSKLGRFVSPDSFGYFGSPSNLYIYARNNPIKFVDPLGTIPLPLILYGLKLTGAAIGRATVSGFLNLGAYHAVQGIAKQNVTTGGQIGSFVGGFVTGLVPAAGFWGRVSDGFRGGIISEVIKQTTDSNDLDFYKLVENGLINGVINGIAPVFDFGLVFSGAFKKFVAQTVYDLALEIEKGIGGFLTSEIFKDIVNDFLGWIRSYDPNDILGPTGFGDARFVAADSTLHYRIRFENEANASAPAQLVTITTSLDSDVDIATFQLGEFGFGNYTNKDVSRDTVLQKTIEFKDERSYVVRVTAGPDVVNRRITWELQTLDPETGRPPIDPGVGFLPPNPENGTDGEGFVTYSIRPNRDVNTYDVIDAEARIIFDKNDPIDTEPTFNTIDRDAPFTQNVSVIDEVLSSGILAVSVTSRDEGAGVRAIDIFSNNGQEFYLLKSSLATEEVIVLDVPTGLLYNLLILPEDNVGNRGSLQTDGVPLEVFFPEVKVSCEEVNNCSGAGNCTSTNLCLCEEGRYGVDCSQEIPPKEPPVIAVSPAYGEEDESLPFPVSVQLIDPSPNDTVEIRLVNVLKFFTSNIGKKDGDDLLLSFNESRDLVLQPLPDLSGEFIIPLEATVRDSNGKEGYRRMDVPIAIIAVADKPIVSLKETCFDFNDEWNSTFNVVFNVTSGDDDRSEIVSVGVSDFWNPSVSFSFYPNATMDTTEIVVNRTLLETDIFNSSVEVTIWATSVEISNGNKTSTTSTFAFSMCESDGIIPIEPPVIEVSPAFGTEDMPLPFPISVQVVKDSENDTVELRLINVLHVFTSNIGTRNAKDVIVPISNSLDLVLQPLPDLAGEFNVSVSATATNDQGDEVSTTVYVPIEITPVADEPVVVVEETCFDNGVDGNTTFTILINVTTGDVDQSEIVSIYVADVHHPSKYVAAFPNVTSDSTQLSVNITLMETDIFSSPVNVTITVTSVEVSNGDKISTLTVLSVPYCDTEGTIPIEPPVIEVYPLVGAEDVPLPFPITVKLTNASPNDTVDLRLINILDFFSSPIGVEDGTDLLISISESQDLVLQPFPDLAGEFNISVNVTITNNQGNHASSAVIVPGEIIPVADEPVVAMEETCFDIDQQMNSIFTIVINVTNQDMDLSEIVSVNVSEPWTPSRNAAIFPNITARATQISVTMTLIHVEETHAPVEVTVHATSREKSNNDQAWTVALFEIPLCEEDDVHVTTKPPDSGACIKKGQQSAITLLSIILFLAMLKLY